MSKSKKSNDISLKSVNKSSGNAKSNIVTPKQKQQSVQNHYLNKNQNSYSSIMRQKKQDTIQSFNKMLNASKMDLKIERSVLGNNSIIISPMKSPNPQNHPQQSKLTKPFVSQNPKNSSSIVLPKAMKKMAPKEESSNENDAFQINLNLNVRPDFARKGNVREAAIQKTAEAHDEFPENEIRLERNGNGLDEEEEGSCEDSGDEILISAVKEDIDNLKSKMVLPDRYVKPNDNSQGTVLLSLISDRLQ